LSDPIRVVLEAQTGDAPSTVDESGGDFGAGLITGYKMLGLGTVTEALGTTFHVDAASLEGIAALLNAKGDDGIDSHLTHPQLTFSDPMPLWLGKTTNAVVGEDGILRGDLHFGQSAAEADRNMVLGRAQERPRSFGSSLAMRGILEDDDSAEGGAPLWRATAVESSDIVGNPASGLPLLSKPQPEATIMAEEKAPEKKPAPPKTEPDDKFAALQAQIATMQAKADKAEAEATDLRAALATNEDERRKDKKDALYIQLSAEWQHAAEIAKTVVPADKPIWLGAMAEGAEDYALLSADATDKDCLALREPDLFRAWLSKQTKRHGTTVAGGLAPDPDKPTGDPRGEYEALRASLTAKMMLPTESGGAGYDRQTAFLQAGDYISKNHATIHAAYRKALRG